MPLLVLGLHCRVGWEAVVGWSAAGRAGELRWCGDTEKDRLKAAGAAPMPKVIVNGTELYYEIRGTGPARFADHGGDGDGGYFDAFAGLLADEFMVVSYDRRGNGLSPAPPGWQTASPR
jgi:hypothetical protein